MGWQMRAFAEFLPAVPAKKTRIPARSSRGRPRARGRARKRRGEDRSHAPWHGACDVLPRAMARARQAHTLARYVAFLIAPLSLCTSCRDESRVRDVQGIAEGQKPGLTLAKGKSMLADDEREAADLMAAFAARTGLAGDGPGVRYLWTDAFAVCNYLGLGRASGDVRLTRLGLTLIDRVHHSLGRYRPDDARSGWISGLDAQQGEEHPTRGGLRIGKALAERGPLEPLDERLEWDRDGQYFHYLTQWMHALAQATRATGNPDFAIWGGELADTAYRKFTYPAGRGHRRMYWKMSTDLSRALVRSMGQHDALDGYVTALELEARLGRGSPAGAALDEVASGFRSMIDPSGLETTDSLGIGGLLIAAHRLWQLTRGAGLEDDRLVQELLDAARAGLEDVAARGETDLPADGRLAFRELGLSIGLRASASMRQEAAEDGASSTQERAALERLARFEAIGARVLAFWREPRHRKGRTWLDHRDIDEVMLATALSPDGFLALREPGESRETPRGSFASPDGVVR